MSDTPLLKNKPAKGICVFCTKCKIKVNAKCGDSGKRISSCSYKDKHRYKLIVWVPGSNFEVKTKLLQSRNPNEAILEAVTYRAELEKANYSTKLVATRTTVPHTLIEAMAYYLAYLNNNTPHEHEHKQRSKGYLNEVERCFTYFNDYLKTVDIDPVRFPFERLDKDAVGKLKSFLLETKNYAPKTYNKYIIHLRGFVNFIIEEFDFRMRNPFKGFKRLHQEKNINTISSKEFHDLLSIVTPENGNVVYKERDSTRKYKKNFYRPWLKSAFLLALLTGRRREEIVMMKFNGIEEDSEKLPITIAIQDFKVNRSSNLSEKESLKIIYVPVISPLRTLLFELGYAEYKDKDMYILAPFETMERKSMMDFISKAFSHYYAQLNTGRDIKFYDLRKTYISHLYAAHGEKARIVTKHSGEDVMLNHYIDQRVVAQVAMDFQLFDL
ncbi:MAG: phage integrase SAM-like domain-containing protein [Bacteroidia bacterium]